MSIHDHDPGGELTFAGEAAGEQFRLQSLKLYNNDDDDKPDVPANESVHGNWIEVETERGDEFLAAPGELIEELQRLDAKVGDLFEVARCEKSGPKQTDPYEVNLKELEDDQSRL